MVHLHWIIFTHIKLHSIYDQITQPLMKGWVSFIGYGARIFSLRASTVSIPTLSSRTCAQIRFARKYGPDPYTFSSYLRADSVCAQVWSRFPHFPLVLARRFGLRASMVPIPKLSSRICAQIRFARKYHISIKII